MSESTFTGPGEVMLAPETWGDIVPINLDGRTTWSVGKDAFLACTSNIVRSTKSQGFGKALCESCHHHTGIGALTLTDLRAVSGEGLFVYQISGQGVMWIQSLGAITSRTLQPGEQWIGEGTSTDEMEAGTDNGRS